MTGEGRGLSRQTDESGRSKVSTHAPDVSALPDAASGRTPSSDCPVCGHCTDDCCVPVAGVCNRDDLHPRPSSRPEDKVYLGPGTPYVAPASGRTLSPDDGHAPRPGPLHWDWRCLRCDGWVDAHPSWWRRLIGRLRRG